MKVEGWEWSEGVVWKREGKVTLMVKGGEEFRVDVWMNREVLVTDEVEKP